VEAEHASGVPDQGLTLSSNGTTTIRTTAKLTTLVAGSALAVGVAVACVAVAPGPARFYPAAARSAAAPGGPGHLRPRLVSALGPAGHAVPSPVRARAIARKMLHLFGWTRRQFTYLNLLWSRESSWNVLATNPASGAYGIPQAVPGVKMASAGPDWRTSAKTQVRWGLRYIRAIYGSPRLAWGHEATAGWY
jgi:hypothetical protein